MGGAPRVIAFAAGVAAVVACQVRSDAADTDTDACDGSKCDAVGRTDTDTDTPASTTDGTDTDTDTDDCEVYEVEVEEVLAECRNRADSAFDPNQAAFGLDHLRWSCLDVPGRFSDERGQEYCEYFAIVQLPTDEANPLVLGLNLGDEFEDGQTPFGVELDEGTVAALEADPDASVGACVFTSWNEDVDYAVRDRTWSIHGVPLASDVFRMKNSANSEEAAIDLLAHCLACVPTPGDPDDLADPLHDDFNRACLLNAELNGTEDRKSDTVICAAAMRLGECGCELDDRSDLDTALAVGEGLGFPLGTWDDARGLPPGCQYEPFGPSGRNIVTCALTAAEVLQNASELKAYCAERHADDVVVHVPIPAGRVICQPWADEPYSETCSLTPWVVGGP
jgi:hypothetical protein